MSGQEIQVLKGNRVPTGARRAEGAGAGWFRDIAVAVVEAVMERTPGAALPAEEELIKVAEWAARAAAQAPRAESSPAAAARVQVEEALWYIEDICVGPSG